MITCVHDHLTSAASVAALLPGAVRVSPHITHVSSGVLPPGSVLARNGLGGWLPDDGSVYQYDSRGVGTVAHDAALCPNPMCRARCLTPPQTSAAQQVKEKGIDGPADCCHTRQMPSN